MKKDYLDPIIVIGILISILLVIISSIIVPSSAQFGFIIGLFGVIITLLIDIGAKLSKFINLHEASEKRLFKIIRDQLSIHEHNSEIFDEIIDDFFFQFRENLHNLAKGFLNVDDGYLTVNDLFRCGEGAIKRARKQIIAVEASSHYDNSSDKPSFKEYHKLTVDAVKRKVDFKRIWIIERNQTEYHSVWKLHRRDGIKTYFVHENKLPDNLKRPDYLDFAVIDEQILLKPKITIERGVGKRYEGGQVSVVKTDIETAQRRFDALMWYAEEFAG